VVTFYLDSIAGAWKLLLVTGAGTGFGAEVAVRAAQEGADVAVHYRGSEAGARQTVARVEAEGRKALLVQADITDWAQIKRMADAVWAGFGQLDVLINNVGDMASEQMSWRDITEESIDHTLAVDIKGTLMCTHEFGSRMLEQDSGGSIVNIGSTVVVRGSARAPQASSRTESHRPALSEPCVNLSTHTAPTIQHYRSNAKRPSHRNASARTGRDSVLQRLPARPMPSCASASGSCTSASPTA